MNRSREAERDALLRQFSSIEHEADKVVRESCEVALDAGEYWSQFKETSSFAQHKAGPADTLPSSSAVGHFNIRSS